VTNAFHPRLILILAPGPINWPKGKPAAANNNDHQDRSPIGRLPTLLAGQRWKRVKTKSGCRDHRFPKPQDHPTKNQPKDESEHGYRNSENQKLHNTFDNAGHLNSNLLLADRAALFAAVGLPSLHGIRVAHKIRNICFGYSDRSSHNKFETIRICDWKSSDDPSVPLEQTPRAACQQPQK
jgi:hypothetical protein